jgi:ABC-type transport system involved in multi-copper enzyme maturation permease subunit
MNDIMTVAQSTFHRIARMKALYFMLLICVLDVAAMAAYGELSLGLEKELMFDGALAICLVVALITALVIAFDVPRELRDKTATYILSKPGGRDAFVCGKFLGVATLVVYNVAIVAVGSALAYRLSFGKVPEGLGTGAALVAAEGVMLVGIGLVFSVLLSDTLAAILTFVCFCVGHLVPMLPRISDNPLSHALYYALPNFYNLDVKTELSHGVAVDPAFLLMGIFYALAYAIALTALANCIFSRKDLG